MDGRVFRATLPADSSGGNGAGPSAPAPAPAVPPSTSRTITDTIIGGKKKKERGREKRELKPLFFSFCRHCLAKQATLLLLFYFETASRTPLRAC